MFFKRKIEKKNYDKASMKPVIRVSICHGEQVTDRKTKNIWLHVFSLVIISMALIMKFVNVAYPAITLVLWYFYIWFFYGSMSAKWVFGLPRK